ncbi:MAG: hypothetical protein IJS10_02145, partial [Alphaproteobacteria bacterium]|nr:hypothetical protein [Alphaproteobacteria bacterium]
MKFNLSKTKYSGGGLYLGGTVVIVASISNCVVNAEENAEFAHFVHEVSWRAYASLKVNDTSKKEWYQAEQYSDSIYNVIANAIADCKMQRNEFDKRNGVYGPYANLITFSVVPMS